MTLIVFVLARDASPQGESNLLAPAFATGFLLAHIRVLLSREARWWRW